MNGKTAWLDVEQTGGTDAAGLRRREAEARTDGAGALEALVPVEDAAACGILRAAGYARLRGVWRLAADLAGPLPEPCWPDAVRVRTYEPADASAVHALLVQAFAGSAERIPPFERWLPWMTGGADFDPECWFLAVAGGEPAGVCLCWTTGFVKDLAVDPAWRRRRLGEALLRHALRELRARGCERVALKVDADNPTGATRLYARAGLEVETRYELFGKAL